MTTPRADATSHGDAKRSTSIKDWVGYPPLDLGATLRCVRELYLLTDDEGRTWLAIGTDPKEPHGGFMPHLVAGQQVQLIGTSVQGITVRVPRSSSDSTHEFDSDLPAYLVPAALLPSLTQ